MAENHRVEMLNTAPSDANHTNVFTHPLLFIEPGDTVTFVPTDVGHNSASKRGMLPEGAKPWNGPMDEEFTIELTVPGIYGYICVPHYQMGMVGLIVVGGDLSNMEDAKSVRQPGGAKRAFQALFEELEQ